MKREAKVMDEYVEYHRARAFEIVSAVRESITYLLSESQI